MGHVDFILGKFTKRWQRLKTHAARLHSDHIDMSRVCVCRFSHFRMGVAYTTEMEEKIWKRKYCMDPQPVQFHHNEYFKSHRPGKKETVQTAAKPSGLARHRIGDDLCGSRKMPKDGVPIFVTTVTIQILGDYRATYCRLD